MKFLAEIEILPHKGLLDPQGKAIHHSVELLGMENIENVRQGKYFEIELNAKLSEADAQIAAEEIAKDVLANPVIEDYKVELIHS